jgi:uncharacterized membrane protein YdjX (TVP38/TMEM64 family)
MRPKVLTLRNLLIPALILAVVISAVFLPVEQLITALQSWAVTHQSSALLVITVSIILGTLLLLPLSLMMMLAGFLFGLGQGFAVVWVAGLIASTTAFWIGRSFARDWIERRIQRQPTFMAIDRAIQRKGFLVVLLTRLVMLVPYPWLNYSLGLTNVSFRDYALATNIGSMPTFFLFVYLGTTVSNIAAIVNGDISLEGSELVIAILGLATVAGLVLLIVRVAGRILKEELIAARK